MSRSALIVLAAGGSLALLLGAWGFQYIGGLAPCKMCYWQRWPHIAAIVIGILAFAGRIRWVPLLGGLSALTTAGIGIYHTGVERRWWEGPSSCSGTNQLEGLSGADLLSTEGVGTIVMCDQVAWEMAGLSMASWNAVFSLCLAALWLAAFLRPKTHPS
ncbi:MAG: disulfide bond formation protein B [Pseudomonadota bacterium]